MVDETKEQETAGGQQATGAPADLAEGETLAEEMVDRESEVETLQRQLEETRDQLMRLAAEFDNYKKRMERERAKLLKYAGENILRELLTPIDNLDRALEQGGAAARSTPLPPRCRSCAARRTPPWSATG